jgi:pyruvate carboxylase
MPPLRVHGPALREFRIRWHQHRAGGNLLKHPTFLNNEYHNTKFIDQTSELFDFKRRDRATKILDLCWHINANGISGNCGSP